MSEKRDTRTRNWTFFVYPESAPENWRDVLNEMHIPWIESPLHDKDVDSNGELEKAHWHILILFASKKSYEQG
ncbi:Rep family protein, partial [Campylobacter coli]|uniref:Rep family protein n=1 Tax=Campylobacter coli TaxID=195 RepID=UPI00311FAEC9